MSGAPFAVLVVASVMVIWAATSTALSAATLSRGPFTPITIIARTTPPTKTVSRSKNLSNKLEIEAFAKYPVRCDARQIEPGLHREPLDVAALGLTSTLLKLRFLAQSAVCRQRKAQVNRSSCLAPRGVSQPHVVSAQETANCIPYYSAKQRPILAQRHGSLPIRAFHLYLGARAGEERKWQGGGQ